ncbi:MAG: NfeD-like protein, partial [Rhodothermales bacterium]
TGTVIIPFDSNDQGKISLISKGQRLQLVARAFEGADETFEPGDEVVVVRVDGRVAEVVKPS